MFRLRILRRLLVGVSAGMVGGTLIYLAGWWLADGLTKKVELALNSPHVPGLTSIMSAQVTLESLAGAGSAVSSPAQVRVMGLAESVGEQHYFRPEPASFAVEVLELATNNACLQSLIATLSLQKIGVAAQPAPTPCPHATVPGDPAKLAALQAQLENEYQATLSELVSARQSDPLAGLQPLGTQSEEPNRQALMMNLVLGQVMLTRSQWAAKNGDIVSALELSRDYAISEQSNIKDFEDTFLGLEYMAATLVDWHNARHEGEGQDSRWLDLKVSAGDLTHDIDLATEDFTAQYRHGGGVEGSIRVFVQEQQEQHGADLVQSRDASLALEQHLRSAIVHAQAIRRMLLSVQPLTQRRVADQQSMLKSLEFGLQIWHLTWGVLAGLIGALLGELMVRTRHWIAHARASSRGQKSRVHVRLYSDAIFPLAGLMLAMLVSVRLTDGLDELTESIVSPLAALAANSWLGYLASVLALGALGTLIGGLAGRFLVPASSRGMIAETDVWLTGTGGVLAGVVVAIGLRWLVGPDPQSTSATPDVLSMQAFLFALALIGGLFGSLIGATLISGGSAAPLGANTPS
ncbi:MAG: hypothetical protein HY243_07715 [Proteobacteria bacterium]|nr:hypothetical protein [Pseudomonadota bacterium]